jgi:hypothetical protein
VKRFCSYMLLLLASAVAPGAAQDTGWRLEVQLLQAGSPSGVRIYSDSEWGRLVSSGEVRVLDSGTVAGKDGTEAQLLVGGKVPLSYHDPRSAGPQVMYVDTGFKVDAMPKLQGNGSFRINCHVSKVHLTEAGTPIPQQDGSTVTTVVVLRPGQVGVVAATRGRLTGNYMKSSYPGAPFSPGDTLLLTLSIRRD